MSKPSRVNGVLIALLMIFVVATGMILYENSMSEVEPGVYLIDGKLSDAQKESLMVMLDLLKLLMNWSIAVIGATGFFLKINVEKDVPLHRVDIFLSFAIIIIAVISLFLGHLVIDKSSEILSLEQFPVNNETIRSLGRYQYVAGLVAIALFGFHVFQFFWVRIKND